MNEQEIKHILEKQRAYFSSGATLDVTQRIEALKNCGPPSYATRRIST